MKLITGFLLLFFTLPCFLQAQIPNDTYADATLIELEPEGFGTFLYGSLLYATPSFTGGNLCGFSYENDLWYKFVAPAEELNLTYTGVTSYFIFYRVINGIPIGVSCLTNNTDIFTNIGETYYLRLLNNPFSSPSFSFKMEYVVPPDPASFEDNDECLDALPATVGIGTCGPTYTFNKDSLTASNPPGSCEVNSVDIWYTIVAPPSGTIEVTELSGNINHVTVFNNDCNALVEESCSFIYSSNPYIIGLTPAQSYLLRMTSQFGISEFCLSEGPSYANLDCSSAELINIPSSCTDTISINLDLATENNEVVCNEEARDIWYEFLAPANGNINISKIGSQNFFMSVYSGSCGSLISEVCHRWSLSGGYFPNLTPGATYKLRIYQYSSQADISFCISTIAPPANEDCSSAISLSIFPNSLCTQDTLDFLGTSFSGQVSPCFPDIGGDAWYTFIASSAALNIYTNSHDVTVYSGSCGSLTPITCISGTNINGLSSGQTYYLQFSQNTPSSLLDFCLISNSPATSSNNTCASATTVSGGSTFTVNGEAAKFETSNTATCTFNPHDLWYEFTSPSGQHVKITDNESSNMEFVLYEGSCGALTEIGCYDFAFGQESIQFDSLNPNTQHYLQFFYELSTSVNQKTFDIEFLTPPTNNLCQTANSISAGNSCSNIAVDFTNATLSNVPLPPGANTNSIWRDGWYDINIGVTGNFTLQNKSIGSAELDELIGVLYNLDCNSLTMIDYSTILDYNDTHTFTQLNANSNYYLRLLTKDADNGEFCVFEANVNFADNDDCENASSLLIGDGECIGQTSANFLIASASGIAATCHSYTKDLWYEVQTSEAGDYVFNKFSTSQIVVSLYSGTCGALTEEYCKVLTSNESFIFEGLAANNTYFLRIGTSSSFSMLFCVQRAEITAEESMCTSAITVSESLDNTCTNAVSGSTNTASPSIGEFCGSPEAEAVFYSFTPSQSTYYAMELSNFSSDHNVVLFADCLLNSPLTCAQNQIAPLLNAGQSYIIAIFPTTPGLTSDFDLCIYPEPILSTENVGISVTNPQTKLDVNGGIKPGNSTATIPGNIRWSGDLEVYSGSEWKSLVEWDHQAQQNIDMNGLRIRSLNDPSMDTDAATKSYVDDHQDADANPTNEIQSLSKSGNTISLSDGGSVTDENTTYSGTDFVVSNQSCPSGQVIKGFDVIGNVICGTDEVNDADNDPTNEIETWTTLGGKPAGFEDGMDDVNDGDFDPINEIQTITKSGSTISLSNGGGSISDAVNDADFDPNNEIQTISKSGSTITLSNSGGSFVDEVNDADNDPSNEDDSADGTTITGDGIATAFSVNHANITPDWSNVQNTPAGFVDGTDDVDDADNDPSNEDDSADGTTITGDGIITAFSVNHANITPDWNNLQNTPAGFADGMDDFNDADNDPTNEDDSADGTTIIGDGITTAFSVNHSNITPDWSNVQNTPAGFTDGTDDVDDADNNISNELITNISRSGTDLTIAEAGVDFTISLDTFANTFVNDGGSVEYPASTTHDFVFGHSQLPTTGITSANFFFFDESQAAFRAGRLLNGNDWNSSLLGAASFAAGHNTEASGDRSVSFGNGSIASGDNAFASGNGTLASGYSSVAMGNNTDATNSYATALGNQTLASGSYSFALGNMTDATGSTSVAMGSQTTASATATTALGILTEASGTYSTATGRSTKAESYNSFALGRFNEGGGSATTWVETDPLFEVGIGTNSGALANAMTILKNGYVGIGESNPGNLLQVKGDGASNTPQLNLTETGSSGDGARITFTNNNSTNRWTLYGLAHNTDLSSVFNIFYNGYGNIMQLTGVGDVGIGGSPNSNLHVFHGSNAGNDGFRLENSGTNDNWMRLYINNSSGNLLLYSKNQGSSSIGNFNDATGAYAATSDRRLKKNFLDLRFDWKDFMKLEPLTYAYKAGSDDERYIGMVAQDVEKIYPEMISYVEEDDVYHMDYSGFGVISIKAVQELKKENEVLKEEIEKLKMAQKNFAQMTTSQNELILNQQKILEAYKAELDIISVRLTNGPEDLDVEEKR